MIKSLEDLLTKLEKTKVKVRQEKADYIANIELQREKYDHERRHLINKINQLRRNKMKERSHPKELTDQSSIANVADKNT